MNIFRFKKFFLIMLCLITASGGMSCAELHKPTPETFYGEVAAPAVNEFRWSNGETPKTFDPAVAALSSEMQAVRAVYDGLTELNSKTLEAAPSIAVRWEMSEDARTFTFYLRSNAVWTNGKRINAGDFVRSWKRLAELGDKSPHHKLLDNIVGAKLLSASGAKALNAVAENKAENKIESKTAASVNPDQSFGVAAAQTPQTQTAAPLQNPNSKIQNQNFWFGVEAVDDFTLRIYLTAPDKDFPQLAAHSALRPIYGDGGDFNKPENAAKLVTNGAFRILSFDKTGVLFERSKNYWNARSVKLERVRFVPAVSAESALAAYRAGEVDAVTSAHFEPLALKLLSSYRDFQRTTFNAVTFYEFTDSRPPFNDRRVREALATAVNRARLSADELDGATVPAEKYLPHSTVAPFAFEPQQAQRLLADAGFPNGQNFPKMRLLINRNEIQNRLAKAIAAQWRKTLNIETEIVVSSLNELENNESVKDFDLVRRVVVLPTSDESVNLSAIFERRQKSFVNGGETENAVSDSIPPNKIQLPPTGIPIPLPKVEPFDETPPPLFKPRFAPESNVAEPTAVGKEVNRNETNKAAKNTGDILIFGEDAELIVTEAEAVELIPAIPLYFPVSYALVKPYVFGFEPNLLDAPSLKDIEIKMDWQPQS